MTLPLAPAARDRPADSVESVAPVVTGGKALRVLVADDNRDSADGCATLLVLAGHDVRTAYSGRDALALADEFLPQIALLDIGMPDMNGYDVARHIRTAAWGRDMQLVAVTGWGQEEDKREAEAAGFDQHRVKPVDLDSLDPLFARCALEAAADDSA